MQASQLTPRPLRAGDMRLDRSIQLQQEANQLALKQLIALEEIRDIQQQRLSIEQQKLQIKMQINNIVFQ